MLSRGSRPQKKEKPGETFKIHPKNSNYQNLPKIEPIALTKCMCVLFEFQWMNGIDLINVSTKCMCVHFEFQSLNGIDLINVSGSAFYGYWLFPLFPWNRTLRAINPLQPPHSMRSYLWLLGAGQFLYLPFILEMENRGSSAGGGWWFYFLLFRNGCSCFLLDSDDVYGWRQWHLYIALLIAAVSAVLASWLIPEGRETQEVGRRTHSWSQRMAHHRKSAGHEHGCCSSQAHISGSSSWRQEAYGLQLRLHARHYYIGS